MKKIKKRFKIKTSIIPDIKNFKRRLKDMPSNIVDIRIRSPILPK